MKSVKDISCNHHPRLIDDALIKDGFDYVAHLIERDVKLFGGNSETNRESIYSNDKLKHRERADRILDAMKEKGWLEPGNHEYEAVRNWLKKQEDTPSSKEGVLVRYFLQDTFATRIEQLPFDDIVRNREQEHLCQAFTKSNNIRFLDHKTSFDTRIDVLNNLFANVFDEDHASLRAGKNGMKAVILDLEENGKLSVTLDHVNYLAEKSYDQGAEFDNLPGSGLVLTWAWHLVKRENGKSKKKMIQSIPYNCYTTSAYKFAPTARALEVAIRACKKAIELRLS